MKSQAVFNKWTPQQKLAKKYYALGLLVHPKYREALIATAKSEQMTILACSADDAITTVFFSLHPELDTFYFEFLHHALIHSLGGKRFLRNMRQRTMTNNTAKIDYENRWFRMAKEDFHVDELEDLDSVYISKIRYYL